MATWKATVEVFIEAETRDEAWENIERAISGLNANVLRVPQKPEAEA